jgi:hypothetical protein
MTKQEFREWRERFALTQDEVAAKFGVSRNTVQNWESGATSLPGTVDDLCKVWEDRLKQETAELGPVTLCYTDAPMFVDPYGPRRKLAMLQQEPYPTNAAALARVKLIWNQPGVHGPFITDKPGRFLWNQNELSRVVDGTDSDAPTVQNALRKVAEYVMRNSTMFVRHGARLLTPAETEARSQRIKEIGEEMMNLATESQVRVVEYSEFEESLRQLRGLGFHPKGRFAHDVAHTIEGEKIARRLIEGASLEPACRHPSRLARQTE